MLSMEELAKECVRIEKAGGDVLAYLREQGKISPRGTWFRIQREILERKEWRMTDGHGNSERKTIGKRSMEENLQVVLQALQEKRSPVQALREIGYKVPEQTYREIKVWAMEHQPETAGEFPKNLKTWQAENRKGNDGLFSGKKPKEPAGETRTVTVAAISGAMRTETADKAKIEAPKVPETETGATEEAKTDGAEMPDIRIVMDETGIRVERKPERKPPVTKPVRYGGYDVTAIRKTGMGEFYHDVQYRTVDWRSPEGEEISLFPEEWMKLAEEIPEVLGILGVRP